MGYWNRYYSKSLGGWKVTRVSDSSNTPQKDLIFLTTDQESSLKLDPTGMFYMQYDPALLNPLTITKDLPGIDGGDSTATFVPGGSTFSASIEVGNAVAPLSYQWQKFSGGNATPITIAQNPTAQSKVFQITNYSAAAAPGAGNGDWLVTVTDAAGRSVTSQRVRTKQAIALSTNLSGSAAWKVGTSATLTVAVNANTGLAPYSYQWFKDGKAIDGATQAALTRASPATGDAGVYYCVATSSNSNQPNTVKSIECTVTVSA